MPATSRDWLPPVPFVTVATVLNPVVALSETCTRKALPYAPSHRSTTLHSAVRAPRSTVSVWLSANVLDQRVVVEPSTARRAA